MPLCVILSDYQSSRSLTFVHNAHNAAEIAAQEETPNPDSQAAIGQQVNYNSQELVGQQELPLDDNPWTGEFTTAVVARPAVLGVERGTRRAAQIRQNLVKALVGGVLSLIVLPGVIIGVMMKEMIAGIAFSTAIIALINLFAGLYYYLNRRD